MIWMVVRGEETPGLGEHVETGRGRHWAVVEARGGGYRAEAMWRFQRRIQPVLEPGRLPTD